MDEVNYSAQIALSTLTDFSTFLPWNLSVEWPSLDPVLEVSLPLENPEGWAFID